MAPTMRMSESVRMPMAPKTVATIMNAREVPVSSALSLVCACTSSQRISRSAGRTSAGLVGLGRHRGVDPPG